MPRLCARTKWKLIRFDLTEEEAYEICCVALLIGCFPVAAFAQNPEQEIRAKTKKFTEAIVSKNLAILDDVFEKDPANIYYDINEGPLVGFERLKRVWTAATTNYTISRFDFVIA